MMILHNIKMKLDELIFKIDLINYIKSLKIMIEVLYIGLIKYFGD